MESIFRLLFQSILDYFSAVNGSKGMESISNLFFPWSPIWLPLKVVYNKSSAMRYQLNVYMLC